MNFPNKKKNIYFIWYHKLYIKIDAFVLCSEFEFYILYVTVIQIDRKI